jgi:hypothetical protein
MTYIPDSLGADPSANGAAPSVQKQLDAVLKDAGGDKEEALRRVLGPDAAAVLPKKKQPSKPPGPAPHGGRKGGAGAPAPKPKPTPRSLRPVGVRQPAHLPMRPDALTVATPRSSGRTWLIIGAVAAAVGGLIWYMRKDTKRMPERA